MLPISRNRTYNDATPVVPGDLDDIQDSIASLWALGHGVRRISVPVDGRCSFCNDTPGTAAFTANSAGGVARCLLDTAGGAIYMPLPFVPGDRILSVRVASSGAAAAAVPHLYFPIDSSSYAQALALDATYNGSTGTDTDAGVTIQQWNVTTPKALWIRNPNIGTPDPLRWARSAALILIANVNNTTVYGADFLYDTTDIIEDG